jgi:hypothetical protein
MPWRAMSQNSIVTSAPIVDNWYIIYTLQLALEVILVLKYHFISHVRQ